MPTLTISLADLKSLVPCKLTDEQVQEILPLVKVSIESFGPELTIEVTPDRPDLFSAEGIARQLRSWLGIEPGLPVLSARASGIAVSVKDPAVRPFLACAAVRGADLREPALTSLLKLQAALDAGLGRDRRKASIGLHDLARVTPPFTYADVAPAAARFVPLDSRTPMTPAEILKKHPKGIAYAHLVPGNAPLLTDRTGTVLSFPPVINGEATRVTEQTKDLFIDITGTDPLAMQQCLNILASALALRGGQIETVQVGEEKTPDLSPQQLTVRKADILSLLGADLKNSELQTLLQRMGYDASGVKDTFIVYAPPYRADLQHPVDVAEDVAIAYGYSNLTPVHPNVYSVGRMHPAEAYTQRLRELAVGIGFLEVHTNALVANQPPLNAFLAGRPVELKNPLSAALASVRTNLLGGLLGALAANAHRKYPQRLFEAGDCVVQNQKAETRTETVRMIGFASAHPKAGLSEIRSVADELGSALGAGWAIVPAADPAFLPGRCGTLKAGGKAVGRLGEVHPRVLAALRLEVPVAALEISVERLLMV